MSNIHSGHTNMNATRVPKKERVILAVQPLTPMPVMRPICQDERTYKIEPFKSLERCYTCNKKFGPNEAIYMYKDLAFCSDSNFTRNKNCRNQEMDKDFEEEKKREAMMAATMEE